MKLMPLCLKVNKYEYKIYCNVMADNKMLSNGKNNAHTSKRSSFKLHDK